MPDFIATRQDAKYEFGVTVKDNVLYFHVRTSGLDWIVTDSKALYNGQNAKQIAEHYLVTKEFDF